MRPTCCLIYVSLPVTFLVEGFHRKNKIRKKQSLQYDLHPIQRIEWKTRCRRYQPPPPTPTNPPHPLAFFFFCCAARYIFKDMMPVCNYYDRELRGGRERNDTAAHFFPPHKITVGNPSVSKLTRPSLKKNGGGDGGANTCSDILIARM